MSESEDPKESSRNDLSNAQFGGGFINAENVNADRIGGDIWNIRNIFLSHRNKTESQHLRNPIQQKLLKVVNTEVESRINSSLHNRVYVVLDKEQNPSMVESPWEMEVKVDSQPKIRLQNTEITTIYDREEIAGRLLILGQPGAGKTTMLLKLAEELIKRAKENFTNPVPVLFTLSAWQKDNQSIKDWLVEQLKDKYGVRKDIGKTWIDNQEVIPLLDGLDEIAPERQELCVKKINDFLHPGTWSNPVVVCSRTEEYQHILTLLQLNNSLELSPFTQKQVYQYLQSTGNSPLWNIISYDTDLNQLARTPLLLNIILLSAQEISIEAWQQFKSAEERLSYLFDVYIHRMLKRPYKGKQPKQENTRRWLVWLAHRLQDENYTDFLIEKIQPYWLKSKFGKLVYNLIVWQVNGVLVFGLSFTLIWGMTYALLLEPVSAIDVLFNFYILVTPMILGLFFGLAFGLVRGIIFGLIIGIKGDNVKISDKIEPVETIKFSGKNFINTLFFALAVGLVVGIFFWLVFRQISLLKIGLISALFFGIIRGLSFGIIGLDIESKTFPNQGIRQSIINVVSLFFITWPFLIILIFLTLFIIQKDRDLNTYLINSITNGLFLGIFIGIFRSGTPAIKHLVLRVILWANGYIPWNYAKFLNYSTNRLFLQRVGGGYRFIHKLLQDHFAQMEFRRD